MKLQGILSDEENDISSSSNEGDYCPECLQKRVKPGATLKDSHRRRQGNLEEGDSSSLANGSGSGDGLYYKDQVAHL